MGAVTDSSLRPIPGAEVVIVLSSTRVTANEKGQFRISGIPSGDYLVSVHRVGFETLTAPITLSGVDTLRLALQMIPAAVHLAPVATTETRLSPRLRDFEERRKRGNGVFYDQDEIEAKNVVTAVDILREVTSLRLVPSGSALVAMSARQGTPCPMQVFVDGIALSGTGPGDRSPFDLNRLPSPKEIAAIEVYAGAASVPIWLANGPQSGKLGCGAILIWSRD